MPVVHCYVTDAEVLAAAERGEVVLAAGAPPRDRYKSPTQW